MGWLSIGGTLEDVTGGPGAREIFSPPSCSGVGTTLCFAVVELVGEKTCKNGKEGIVWVVDFRQNFFGLQKN